MRTEIPDTPADLVELTLRAKIQELQQELALAESLLEAQQRQLIAVGVLDPELGL